MADLVTVWAVLFGAAMGALDHRLAQVLGLPEREVRRLRRAVGISKRGGGAA
jgi:TRAP-type C4-dicarboxylate transport system permease small subunit